MAGLTLKPPCTCVCTTVSPYPQKLVEMEFNWRRQDRLHTLMQVWPRADGPYWHPTSPLSHSNRVPWPIELLLACLCGSGLVTPGIAGPGPHRAAEAHPAPSGSAENELLVGWWASGRLVGHVTAGVCLGAAGPGCFRLLPPTLVPAILSSPLHFCHINWCVCTYMYIFLHIKMYRSLSVETLQF